LLCFAINMKFTLVTIAGLVGAAAVGASAAPASSALRGNSFLTNFMEVQARTTLRAALENRLEGTRSTTSMTCEWYFSCAQCATVANCGWCNDCGRCVEGGTTGPAETNCLSWDHQECSGKDGFDDEMLKSNQDELKERSKLVSQWKLERAAFVMAKDNIARIEATIAKGKQSGAQGKGEAAESKQKLFPAETAKKSAESDCKTLTKLANMAKDDLAATEKSLKDTEGALAAVAKKIGESTDDDEKLRLKGERETLTKQATQYKTGREAQREKTEKASEKAQARCQAADAATGELKAAEKDASAAKDDSKSRNDLLDMQETMLLAAKAEMSRSKAAAATLSKKVQGLTKKLADIRSAKQANGKRCSRK
jgi:hypothetical protein